MSIFTYKLSYKLMSTLSISSILFSTIVIFPLNISAADKGVADRAEMRALKMEKAKLHAKERLLKLKTALELKDHQMTVWNTYSKTMTDNASQNMPKLSKKTQMHTNSNTKPTSIELAKINIARLEHKLQRAKARLAAFSKLYSVLNDQQKEKVDSFARRKIHREAKALRRTQIMMNKMSMKHKRINK